MVGQHSHGMHAMKETTTKDVINLSLILCSEKIFWNGRHQTSFEDEGCPNARHHYQESCFASCVMSMDMGGDLAP